MAAGSWPAACGSGDGDRLAVAAAAPRGCDGNWAPGGSGAARGSLGSALCSHYGSNSKFISLIMIHCKSLCLANANDSIRHFLVLCFF